MPLEVATIAAVGGLQGSVGDPQPSSYDEAENFIINRGRMAVRAPLVDLLEAEDSTGGAGDAIVGIGVHLGKLYYAVYDDTENEVNLYHSDMDGTNGVSDGQIWTSVTTQPTAVIMQSFTAGAADSSEDRLYISDYDQNFVTKYWNGSTFTSITRNFDQGGGSDNVDFAFLVDYQFHLWGSGFAESSTTRPEIVRFSTPGAIPTTDPVDSVSSAWWVNDFIPIGKRGDPITAMIVVNQRLLICQQNASHVISGYDRTTWTVTNISPELGAVGPRAIAHYDGKVAFMWTSNGPAMSDGTQVIDITEPIRDEVDALEPNTAVVVVVDPVVATAFFYVQDEDNTFFAFNIVTQQWTTGSYGIEVNCAVTGVDLGIAAAGPGAAPSSITIPSEYIGQSSMKVTWTIGDLSHGTKTELYRHTSTGYTPGPTYLIATLETGVDEYTDTGLDPSDEYFYTARHLKNGQYSAAATEVSGKTKTAIPSGGLAKAQTGIIVHYTNNDDDAADIVISRRDYPDGAWAEIATESAVAASASDTYVDTTGTAGEEYQYRIHAEVSGYPDSSYLSAGIETSHAYQPQISNVSHIVTSDPVKPWIKTVSITWTMDRGTPDDYVWIYRDVGSGYVKLAEIAVYRLVYSDLFECPYTDTNPKYRLNLYDNNIALVQTEYEPTGGTDRIDPCAAV